MDLDHKGWNGPCSHLVHTQVCVSGVVPKQYPVAQFCATQDAIQAGLPYKHDIDSTPLINSINKHKIFLKPYTRILPILYIFFYL